MGFIALRAWGFGIRELGCIVKAMFFYGGPRARSIVTLCPQSRTIKSEGAAGFTVSGLGLGLRVWDY